jgi:hypothetical protein
VNRTDLWVNWVNLSKTSVFFNLSSDQNHFICIRNHFQLVRKTWLEDPEKKSRFENHWEGTNPDSFHKFTRISIHSVQNRRSHLSKHKFTSSFSPSLLLCHVFSLTTGKWVFVYVRNN